MNELMKLIESSDVGVAASKLHDKCLREVHKSLLQSILRACDTEEERIQVRETLNDIEHKAKKDIIAYWFGYVTTIEFRWGPEARKKLVNLLVEKGKKCCTIVN